MPGTIKAVSRTEKPLYQKVADGVREQILNGTIKPSQFPTENVLCDQWRVSRFTVRQALQRLQDEGFITRKRGSGTVIRPAAVRRGALHQPLSNVEEILQYARDTDICFEPRGIYRLPRKLAEELGQPVTLDWYKFSGLRMRQGFDLPIASTEVYVNIELAEAVSQMDPSKGLLFRELEERAQVQVHTVTQDIQAVIATPERAILLKAPRNTAQLRIVRCYFDKSDRLLQVSISYHPGDRFAYTMHIETQVNSYI